MNTNWIGIAFWGAIGVLSRYAIDTWVSKCSLHQPMIGTFLINTFGCLVAGFLIGLSPHKALAEDSLRLGLIIGFCGGFTTMSGFSIQVIQLANSGRFTHSLLYAVGSPLVCLISVIAGLSLARITN